MELLKIESFNEISNRHDLAHWHDNIEIIRVLENEMTCIVNKEIFLLGKDDICIINRNQLHRILENDNKECKFQRITIDSKIFSKDEYIYNKYIYPILTDESFHHVLSKKGTKFTTDILNILDGISDLETNKSLGYELQIISLIYLLFTKLYQFYQDFKNKSSQPISTDVFIYRRMSGYVYENYKNKISLDDIASIGHVSKSKCISLFKEYTSHSPVDFLNLYRLKISVELLEKTSYSIGEIAMESGFEQQSYYNRLFLRNYSMTPGQYRKSLKEKTAQ